MRLSYNVYVMFSVCINNVCVCHKLREFEELVSQTKQLLTKSLIKQTGNIIELVLIMETTIYTIMTEIHIVTGGNKMLCKYLPHKFLYYL